LIHGPYLLPANAPELTRLSQRPSGLWLMQPETLALS
jgi:hypothetical protein